MTSSGTASGLPLRLGDEGVAVRDLHRRLAASGYSVTGHPERFSPATETSLKAFQASRRLSEDGICGRQTWAALVEAAHNLGDRMLYLRSPMTRGDDVTDLQQRLGSLGFDAGYVDGIFGPDTELAVRNFQHNQAVTADGVVGPGTVQALARLAGRSSGEKTITEVREKENLRRTAPSIEKRRFVIGETGGIPGIVDTAARRLRLDGAKVLTLHHPDPSTQARAANEWGGEAYIGITLAADDLTVAYFKTDGFISAGGHGLALRSSERLSDLFGVIHRPVGMRLPLLRETRMPAIWCRLGPPADVVSQASAVADTLRAALTAWCGNPIDG